MPVLTVINAGNTVVRVVQMASDRQIITDDRYPSARVVQEGLALQSSAAPTVLVSVVPAITQRLRAQCDLWELRIAHVACTVAYDPPDSLGRDRLANAIALRASGDFGVIVDCGTATTLTVVDPHGTVLGGAILPGVGTMQASLHSRTAQLPLTPLEWPDTPWGSSTTQSIQLGILQGHIGAITHLATRMLDALPPGGRLVLTGGWSRTLSAHLAMPHACAPDLTIVGAWHAWSAYRLNAGSSSPGSS